MSDVLWFLPSTQPGDWGKGVPLGPSVAKGGSAEVAVPGWCLIKQIAAKWKIFFRPFPLFPLFVLLLSCCWVLGDRIVWLFWS